MYDVSAKISSKNKSFNGCLETEPPLQNLIWGILTRSRFRPILLCRDIEKVFLQIYIQESERDVLRFHWVDSLESKIIEILRFIRLVFGLTQFSFTFEGTLKKYFENYMDSFEKLTKIIENIYVDDLVTGGSNLKRGQRNQTKISTTVQKRGFLFT